MKASFLIRFIFLPGFLLSKLADIIKIINMHLTDPVHFVIMQILDRPSVSSQLTNISSGKFITSDCEVHLNLPIRSTWWKAALHSQLEVHLHSQPTGKCDFFAYAHYHTNQFEKPISK